jgi:hypothetical protein
MTDRSTEEFSIAIISFDATERHKHKFNIENSIQNITTPAIALEIQALCELFPVNKHPTFPSCKSKGAEDQKVAFNMEFCVPNYANSRLAFCG